MINNIQGLRAVAASAVVLVHLNELFRTVGLDSECGAAGVDLFFVISGFVMVLATKKREQGAIHFLKNRIARIVPIYWLLTLTLFSLTLIAPSLLQATTADPLELLKSLAFIPFMKSNGLVQPTLFVGWTLNYEMFFYLLFALGLILKSPKVGLIATIATLISLVVVGELLQPSNVLIKFYTSPVMLEFGFGMIAALLAERMGRGLKPPTALLLRATALAAFTILFFGPLIWPQAPQVVVLGGSSFILVLAAVALERAGLSLNNRYVLLIGEASYALYLTHPWVTQTVQRLAFMFHPTGILSLIFIFVAFVVAILMGVMIHLFIELRLTKFARTLLRLERTSVTIQSGPQQVS